MGLIPLVGLFRRVVTCQAIVEGFWVGRRNDGNEASVSEARLCHPVMIQIARAGRTNSYPPSFWDEDDYISG
jgi:hypothetical protein